MPPRTTVIMPVRDGEAFIAKAIESALAQLQAQDEILIIDDRSADATRAIVLSFDDLRVRLISARGVGVSAARNTGIALAAGDFIAFLDADDEWPPGRQNALLTSFANRPEIGAVLGRIRIKIESDAPALAKRYTEVDGHVIPGGALSAGLFRRSALTLVGGFAEDMAAAEDVDFFYRLQEAGMMTDLIESDSLIYRRHASNMTNDLAALRKWFMEMLRRKIARQRTLGASVV